jgi:hypothetical protein
VSRVTLRRGFDHRGRAPARLVENNVTRDTLARAFTACQAPGGLC